MNKKMTLGFTIIFMILVIISACSKFAPASDFKVEPVDGGKGVQITKYVGDNQIVNIPPRIGGMTVTSIAARAFSPAVNQLSMLTNITIPAGVTSIGNGAFAGCGASITVDRKNPNYANQDGILYNKAKTAFIFVPQGISGNVTIPEGVTSIEDRRFWGRGNLTSISIPSSVTSIGDLAFTNSGLTSITVDANNPNYASQDGIVYNKVNFAFIFIPPRIDKVTIPAGITSIEPGTFNGRQLTSVTIPDSVISIGENTFSYNQLTSVTIPDSVTSIGDTAFHENQLTSITIGSNVSIGELAFSETEWNETKTQGPINSIGFREAYNNGGKQTGTYTRPNINSKTWTRR